MKFSKLLISTGLVTVIGGASSQVFAATKACPTNFKIDKSLCQCTSEKTVTCRPGGELLYGHKYGVDVNGNTLRTKNGTIVICEGKTWGVRLVSSHVGFRCVK